MANPTNPTLPKNPEPPSTRADRPSSAPTTVPAAVTPGVPMGSPVVIAPAPIAPAPHAANPEAVAASERANVLGPPPGDQIPASFENARGIGRSVSLPGDAPHTAGQVTDASLQIADEQARAAGGEYLAITSATGRSFGRAGMRFGTTPTILKRSELSLSAERDLFREPSLKVIAVSARQAEDLAIQTDSATATTDTRGLAELRVALAAAESRANEAEGRLATLQGDQRRADAGLIPDRARVGRDHFRDSHGRAQ